jgi:hypothetical protein
MKGNNHGPLGNLTSKWHDGSGMCTISTSETVLITGIRDDFIG